MTCASPPLDPRSLLLRRQVVDSMISAGRGHLGPAMSLMEIIRVLYDDILSVRPDQPLWPDRDRCILSKGHGVLALYALLADKGFFPAADMAQFCRFDSYLGGHPQFGCTPGVDASTGALGHGLSIGVGLALAARLQNRPSRVFVIMGDGEINEGTVWEAAMSASKHGLDRLVALVDYNKQQSYGPVDRVQPLEPLADKWRSFGFAVAEVDGHDVQALRDVLQKLPLQTGKPSLILCHTVKGKGIPDAENNPQWHHKNKLTAEEQARVMAAIGGL